MLRSPAQRSLFRFDRLRLAVGLLVLALLGVSLGPVPASAAEVRPIVLPIHPDFVAAVHWSDTYGAPRSGGRSHLGVDMLGPKMTPLVAAVDGQVTWLRHNATSGNNLEITDADGWQYHYIHINNDTPGTDDGANDYEFAFAPGIVNGATVRAGQVVAFLGDSGNAENTGAHLHFEIEKPDGTPINPTPSVDAAFANLGSGDPANTGPYADESELIADLFVTLAGREPTASEAATLAALITSGRTGEALEPYVSSDSLAADIDRLYVAFFHRLPDLGGYDYWIDTMANGVTLVEIAEFFSESEEFQLRYGDLDFGAFLDRLYVDVLGRVPDESGKEYWLELLDDGVVTKGTIVSHFTDSAEMRALAAHRSELVALTAVFRDRMPTDEEIAVWSADRNQLALAAAIEAEFFG